MKKISKTNRLALNKETVRSLSKEQLEAVQGGIYNSGNGCTISSYAASCTVKSWACLTTG